MKYDIVMLCPGMAFDGNTIKETALGGSETSADAMAKSLAKLGHRVTMFSNCEKGCVVDDVIYRPLDGWLTYSIGTPHDINIVQRSTEPFINRLSSKLNLLWCHDLALGRSIQDFRGILWNLDKAILLSDFMVNQYKDAYQVTDDIIFKSRNGIDLSHVPEPIDYRNYKQLVYAARAERGLDNMLDIFSKLLEKDPEFELLLCGYDNTVEHMKPFYAQIGETAMKFGDKCKWMGHLSKTELYKMYNSAGVYVYPTPSPTMPQFDEIYCISILEAQACGLPIVTSNRGAIPETMHPDAGTLIDGLASKDNYKEKFIDGVLNYVNDRESYQVASKAGRAHAQTLSWNALGQEWTDMFDESFASLNDSPKRLARYFYKNNDIIPAIKLLVDNPEADPEFKKRLDVEYDFISSPVKFKEHYQKGGENADDRIRTAGIDAFEHYFVETQERRFHEIEKFLKETPGIKRVLDFGCGHGWCDVYMANKVDDLEIFGVDVDPMAIHWSREFAKRFAPDKNLTFKYGDHNIDLKDEEKFDLLLISEVLEHCVDPWEIVDTLEKWVKPGGKVLITVPYGPSEYGTWNWIWFRNHIWSFELHDIQDMFGGKEELAVDAAIEKTNEHLGDVTGFYLLTYDADDKPLGKLDWDRKFKLQRPRQTLSASIIAGPNCEDTLKWCLRSIAPITDEIIIGDTGMSEDAKYIANQFEAKLVPADNPIKGGFDVPRNQSLAACTMDHVLWIDTDEHLVSAVHLTKYLRESTWNGFGIKQHHFTIDAGFEPDMPVRVFRNRPCEDRNMQFIGKIHEHPELEMNAGPGAVIVLADVNIAHVGYLSEEIRRIRFMRNRPLLKMDIEAYPDRLLQKHFIMRDNCLLNTYDIQQNGGQITEEMRARSREVCDLYRTYFLGKEGYMSIDSAQYYSQAMELLGEGVLVSFDLRVNRDGAGDDIAGGVVTRVADADELRREIDKRIKEKMDSLMPEYW